MKVVGENALERLINLIKAKFDSLAKVATSGSYNDLSDKPTIPSVGNGKITIKQGGTTKGTFTVNQTGATTIELTDTDTVTTVTTTGSGNAVTSITDDNGKLTVTKGSTFLTAHPTISTTTDTTSTASPAHGETFTAVDSVVRDGNGHVTKVNTKTITLPTDNDTHYASGTVVTNDATKTGNYAAALTNGNVYLNHVENGAVKNSHKITGSGATTVTSDASGNIIITSTDNNTTYGVATTSANGLMSSTDKSKLDNLQVGGRNLYTQSTAFQNLIATATTERDADINGFIVTCNSDGNAHPRINNIIEGKTWYTVSAYIKADTSCTMAWDVCDFQLGSINITTEYQYFKGTVYNSRSNSPVYNFVDIEVNAQGANNKLYFKNFKVEKGTMATDWTPAPEDLAAKDHTHTKLQITDFPTSLKNPKGLSVQVNGDGASEVRYDGSVAKTINFVAGDNVTLTQDTANNKVSIAATDTTYSTGTGNTAGITKLYSGLGSNTDGTMTQLAIGDALAGKAGSAHTHTKSDITDFPTSLKNPNGLRVQVNGDGASEVRYDGSEAKTINIKAGSNVTITSDSSGNIAISSTASAGSVTGDVGTVVYEASSGGLYCDGNTSNTTANSTGIPDGNFSYKRFRFYCQGYYGLVCVDMPLDRECYAYATGDDRGKRYGGVIFPTAENSNIESTGIGASNHMYYELKWRVAKEAAGWRVRVVDSGWLGLKAGKTSDTNYTNNVSTEDAGTGYVSWNQRHNNLYCIYKIVAYTI